MMENWAFSKTDQKISNMFQLEKFPNSFIDEVIVSFYFLINNGIVLNKKPGTSGVYMKNSTEVIVS